MKAESKSQNSEREIVLNPEIVKIQHVPTRTLEKAYWISGAYREVSIIFECGKYRVGTGACIRAVYPADYKHLGYFTKDQITEIIEERNKTSIEFNEKLDTAIANNPSEKEVLERLRF